MDPTGKIALITGGSRGIGRSIAEALLRAGARVFLCGRDPEALREALESLSRECPGRVDGIPADVRSPGACKELIRRAVERFGGIDILVNNAGIGIFKPIAELTPEEWDATIETNLSGAFYCAREAVPILKARGGGYIFNISSLAGINAFAGGAAYNASKFGLNGFSEALMQDVRHDGIRVSYILPGSVATDFGASRRDPAGRSGEEWKLMGEDVARAVVDLLRFPERALASRVEIRPSRPPKK